MRLLPPSDVQSLGFHAYPTFVDANGVLFWSSFANSSRGNGWFVFRQPLQSPSTFVLGPKHSGALAMQPNGQLGVTFQEANGERHFDVVAEFARITATTPVPVPVPAPAPTADAELRNLIMHTGELVSRHDNLLTDYSNWLGELESRTLELYRLIKEMPTEGRVHDIAAAQAWNVLRNWWNDNIDYKRREVYNTIYNRIVGATVYLNTFAREHPGQKYPINNAESLRIP
jgi:hypothetical protein